MDRNIIDFYSKAIEKNYQMFASEISNIAAEVEDIGDEGIRQQTIMEDMMEVFETISKEYVHEKPGWNMSEADKLTDYQLKTIIGILNDHFPNVVNSCNIIIEEGF